MKRQYVISTFALITLPCLAYAMVEPLVQPVVQPQTLSVKVTGIRPDATIDEHYALCKPTPDGKSQPGDNTRPEFTWSPGPDTTKSYAIFVMDPDVPADFSDAGKDGRIVRNDAKRQQFLHWALINVPSTIVQLAGGDATVAPTAGKQMETDLKGYVKDPKGFGGPCPPWNDERLHHYHYMVLALDVESLKLSDFATAKEALSAALPHVVARGESMGTYTLNPILRGGK